MVPSQRFEAQLTLKTYLTQPSKKMASLKSNPTNPRGRDEVYVAATPLRATKGPAQFLMSTAFSLNLWHLQHFMLIIKPSTVTSQALVYDFQPQDPEDLYVAVAALSGRAVPGTVLVRKISKLPRNKCWFIGLSSKSNAVEAAYKFNSSWETGLQIGKNDCRHYTNGLAEALTGEENVLERLRRSVGS